MGRKRAPKKSDLFGHELIVGMGLVLVALLSVVFYKALHSKPMRPDETSADGVAAY